jgi:hypothetical protein
LLHETTFFFFPGTLVDILDIFEQNPLLEVDSSNLCVDRLRPDFVDGIYFPSSENEDYEDGTEYCGNLIFGYI